LARLAPQVLLPGKPVRGGGRAAGAGLAAGIALEVARLNSLAPALQRRLLRYAAEQFGAALDFDATESLRALALGGCAGQKLELAGGLRAERTAREVRLSLERGPTPKAKSAGACLPQYSGPIPGEIDAPAFGVCLRIEFASQAAAGTGQNPPNARTPRTAILRNWKPGDRVRLRYSGSSRKVKEVLERMRVTGTSRELWPVLEIDGRILWMRGVELEPEPDLVIKAAFTGDSGAAPSYGPET
jgi:tRNA(Ile)-lysidine synthase